MISYLNHDTEGIYTERTCITAKPAHLRVIMYPIYIPVTLEDALDSKRLSTVYRNHLNFDLIKYQGNPWECVHVLA